MRYVESLNSNNGAVEQEQKVMYLLSARNAQTDDCDVARRTSWPFRKGSAFETLICIFATSLFKSEDSFIKKNYRPITVLPAVSKIYERIIQDQIIPFMEPVMSIYGKSSLFSWLHDI